MIRDRLQKDLKKAVAASGLEVKEVRLEHPAEPSHGDYSSNIAMAIFSKAKNRKQQIDSKNRKAKSPMELAEAIALEIRNLKLEILDKVEVAPPGFINFWLSKDTLGKELELALKEGERYGEGKTRLKKKIMVEFTDPNPFKEFHIGHLYSNTVGEALCRLFEAQGAKVWRVNYQGDVGLHVAKALWGLKSKSKNKKSKLEDLEKEPLGERVKVLGEAYAMGNRAYEEDEDAKREIEELNRKVYAQDPEIQELYQKGRQWSLDYFETIYTRLGTKFKRYYFESEAGEAGLTLVKQFLAKGVFQESEGAVIFPGKKYGLHNRVFINRQGLPTYEAKDMGLAPTKYKDFPYGRSYIVTGNEQVGYFKVVLRALQAVNPGLGAKTHHISHGVVRLPTGKMGSRTGQIVRAEWLLDETKLRLKGAYPEMPEATAEKVAVGAVKYALLRAGIGKDVIFDFEKSLSFEGDSGPYLQYTYARTQSVLRKAKSTKQKAKIDEINPEEEAVLRTFYRFPEVVQDAAEGFAPNLLCNFLFDLAQKYNVFYNKHRILGATTNNKQHTTQFRLALTQATGNILKSGLSLLGIKAPERM